MKTFLAIIGAFIMFFFILGGLGIADFHLCIAAAGKCSKIESSS